MGRSRAWADESARSKLPRPPSVASVIDHHRRTTAASMGKEYGMARPRLMFRREAFLRRHSCSIRALGFPVGKASYRLHLSAAHIWNESDAALCLSETTEGGQSMYSKNAIDWVSLTSHLVLMMTRQKRGKPPLTRTIWTLLPLPCEPAVVDEADQDRQPLSHPASFEIPQ